MDTRWVPPPNWPPAPPGFSPPPGWQPDPAWPPAPTGWEFWQPVDTRSWWQRPPILWGVVVGSLLVVLFVVGISVSIVVGSHSRIDSKKLDSDIEQWMTRTLGSTNPSVHCPSHEPAKAGTEFICSATDSSGSAHIDVLVLNSNGDVKWHLIG
jgi:Domain of unknown function (DUF4333)